MGSALTTIGLPVALGIIMFGLGLSLTLGDFARVAKHPRAVVVALACQLLVLPALCFGLVLAFQLPPLLAIGMMLLAASPGGTTANLYSHLFGGDIAAEEVGVEVGGRAAGRGGEQHHADGEHGRQCEEVHEPERDERQQDELAGERDEHRLRMLADAPEIGDGEAEAQAEHDDAEGDGQSDGGQR